MKKFIGWMLLGLLSACGGTAKRATIERPPKNGEEWREVADKMPDTFGPRLYVAYDALGHGNWMEFDRVTDDLEKLSGMTADMEGALGTVYLVAGQSAPPARTTQYLDAARRHLQNAVKGQVADPGIYFNYGQVCFLSHDYAAAAGPLQQYFDRKPSDVAAVRLLVQCLIEQGEPAAALKILDKAEIPAKSTDRYELTALCHYMMGQFKRAVQEYEEAIKLSPENARLWHNLGLCYEEIRQTEEANSCFAKAEELRKRTPHRD
jgi:Flp pilus assembly protein TadD